MIFSQHIHHDFKLPFFKNNYTHHPSTSYCSRESTAFQDVKSMAPSATETITPVPVAPGKSQTAKPWVKSTGALDQYENFEVTPVIGREYPHANLVSWLKAPNSDELLRELALTSTCHLQIHRV
jgi:hypothetical protein